MGKVNNTADEIARRYQELNTAMVEDKDPEWLIGEFYEESITLVDETGKVYKGMEGLFEYFTTSCMGISYVYEPHKINGDGEWGYSLGRIVIAEEGTFAPTGQVQQTFAIWHKTDGKWRLHLDSIIGARSSTPDNQNDIVLKDIIARYKELNDAIKEDKDPEWLIGEFYDDKVIFIGEDGTRYNGVDGLFEYFMVNCETTEFRYKSKKVCGGGDWAYHLGVVDKLDQKTKKIVASQKSFSIWRKIDGKWKFHLDSLIGEAKLH